MAAVRGADADERGGSGGWERDVCYLSTVENSSAPVAHGVAPQELFSRVDGAQREVPRASCSVASPVVREAGLGVAWALG